MGPAGKNAAPTFAEASLRDGAALLFSPGQKIGHEMLPDFALTAGAEFYIERLQTGVIGDDPGPGDGADFACLIDGKPYLPQTLLGIFPDQGSRIPPMRP